MSNQQLEDKFRSQAARLMPPDALESFIDGVWSLPADRAFGQLGDQL
jgi:hypothetical protein